MKKIISVLLLTALLVGAASATAFAYGGYGKSHCGARQQVGYTLCTADGCDATGLHQHGEAWYCSQNNYEVCSVEGCAQPGVHEHDGTYYYCANRSTGRGCCGGGTR